MHTVRPLLWTCCSCGWRICYGWFGWCHGYAIVILIIVAMTMVMMTAIVVMVAMVAMVPSTAFNWNFPNDNTFIIVIFWMEKSPNWSKCVNVGNRQKDDEYSDNCVELHLAGFLFTLLYKTRANGMNFFLQNDFFYTIFQ